MNIEEYIRKNIDYSFQGNELPFKIRQGKVKKGEVICDYNQMESKVYFLQKGIVQVNIENANKDIRIVDFFFENSFFCSYASLLTSAPSDVQIVATTNCDLEEICGHELFQAYKHSLIVNQLGRYETEKLYLKRVKREKEFLTQTAEERYINLISANSEITNHLSIDAIAKYLGIHPESLSGIRRKSIQRIKKTNKLT